MKLINTSLILPAIWFCQLQLVSCRPQGDGVAIPSEPATTKEETDNTDEEHTDAGEEEEETPVNPWYCYQVGENGSWVSIRVSDTKNNDIQCLGQTPWCNWVKTEDECLKLAEDPWNKDKTGVTCGENHNFHWGYSGYRGSEFGEEHWCNADITALAEIAANRYHKMAYVVSSVMDTMVDEEEENTKNDVPLTVEEAKAEIAAAIEEEEQDVPALAVDEEEHEQEEKEEKYEDGGTLDYVDDYYKAIDEYSEEVMPSLTEERGKNEVFVDENKIQYFIDAIRRSQPGTTAEFIQAMIDRINKLLNKLS